MSNNESPVIKARGLPWSATEKDVIAFFSDVNIVNGEGGVHFTFTRDGKPSGECFLEVASIEDMEKSLAHDNEHMGKRYIEVKQAKQSEMEWVVNRMSSQQNEGQAPSDGVVRLRGLPFGCSKQDIAAFFGGLQISPYGITITMDQDGRASGDAYVEFATQDDADKAMGKHKEKIGHRYIEIFKSSKADIKYVVGSRQDARPQLMSLRPGPYDRPNFNSPNRARGRGGMNLGPSGFNSHASTNNYNSGSNYGDGMGMRASRGGKGGPMRGGRMGGNTGGGGLGSKMVPQNSKTGHSVHMRGLPFEATVNDVMSFFAPINAVDVRLLYEPNTGRPKGECDVDFSTHADAEAAMQRDKQNMGHRYIELFIKSSPNGSMGWSANSNISGSNNSMLGRNTNNNQMGGGNYGGGYGGGNNQMGGNMNENGNMGGGGSGGNNNDGGRFSSGYNSFSDNVAYPGQQQQQQPSGGNYFGMR